MLVHFLQRLWVLLHFCLLLVEGLVREFFEEFCVDFLHDEVEGARCDEFGDRGGVTW